MVFREIGARAYGILRHPPEEFRKVREEPFRKVLIYTIVLFVVSALLILGVGYAQLLLAGTPGSFLHFSSSWQLFFTIFMLLARLLGLLVLVLWFHLWVYLLGGRKGIGKTVTAYLYSQTPVFLLGWIPLPGISRGLLLLLMAFWVLWILFVGIEELQEISGTMAFAAVIFALVAWLLIAFLATMALAPPPVEASFASQNWLVI